MVEYEYVIEYEFFERLIEFAKKYPHTEWGGMLLGNTKDKQVRIYGCIFPPQKSQRSTYCEFDGRELIFVKNIIRELHENRQKTEFEKIVGWIHTHPNLGLFLSCTDKETFEIWSRFDKDAVAIVVDPFCKERAIAFSSELKKIELRLEKMEYSEESMRALVELHANVERFNKNFEDDRKGRYILITRDIREEIRDMNIYEEEIIKIPNAPSLGSRIEKRGLGEQNEYLIKIAKLESHIKVILQRLLEIECEIKELNSIIEERKDEGISVVIRRERRSSKRSKDIRKIERRV